MTQVTRIEGLSLNSDEPSVAMVKNRRDPLGTVLVVMSRDSRQLSLRAGHQLARTQGFGVAGLPGLQPGRSAALPTDAAAQAELDRLKLLNTDVRSVYDSISKTGFAVAADASLYYRVGRSTRLGDGGISHSEGQGCGMVLAVLSSDADAFAALARWTDATLTVAGDDLYAWRYDPHKPNTVPDPNNATDGDMLIAWALALAGKSWRNDAYLGRSAQLRAAIRRDCVIERFGRQLLLPGRHGFAAPSAVTANPSYYVWPALDVFARLDGAAVWGSVFASGEALLRQARFGPLHLPRDWVSVTGAASVAPARDKPSRATLRAAWPPSSVGRRCRYVVARGDRAAPAGSRLDRRRHRRGSAISCLQRRRGDRCASDG